MHSGSPLDPWGLWSKSKKLSYINENIRQGKYLQCHGCRRPITNRDTKSVYYKKGVSCPSCFNERSTEQKKRSLTRQNQIERAEKKKEDHPFKKIKLNSF